MSKFALFLLPLFFMTACASGRGPGPGPIGAGASLDQPGRVLAAAREQQAKQGCAKALPAYRVVSAYGEGFDVAQYELGACLLELSAEEGPETALFSEEALFWLRRAAWAGNARAQRALATTLSGADGSDIAPNHEEAMGWALIYGENSDRDLYNLPSIETSILQKLNAALSPNAIEAAERFAKSYAKISMDAFTPPAREADPSKMQKSEPPPKRRRR